MLIGSTPIFSTLQCMPNLTLLCSPVNPLCLIPPLPYPYSVRLPVSTVLGWIVWGQEVLIVFTLPVQQDLLPPVHYLKIVNKSLSTFLTFLREGIKNAQLYINVCIKYFLFDFPYATKEFLSMRNVSPLLPEIHSASVLLRLVLLWS